MHRRHRTSATALALTALALTGCSGGDDAEADNTPPSTSPSSKPAPSKSSADPQQGDKDAALKAYLGYMGAQDKAFSKVKVEGSGLDEYSHPAAPAYKFVADGVNKMRGAGSHAQGKLGHDAEINKLGEEKNDNGKVLTAHVRDCLDISKQKSIDKDGKVVPLPSNQPKQYWVTAVVEDWGKGGWRVIEYDDSSTTPC